MIRFKDQRDALPFQAKIEGELSECRGRFVCLCVCVGGGGGGGIVSHLTTVHILVDFISTHTTLLLETHLMKAQLGLKCAFLRDGLILVKTRLPLLSDYCTVS